jgi:hypothetical protein
MSGRLVISRHKSWHVWNQDNVEKVLRDERIHNEKLKAKQDKELDTQRELNLELLKYQARVQQSDSDAENRDEEHSRSKHSNNINSNNTDRFVLFDNEELHQKEIKLKEKKIEEESKLLLLQRQNGVAPWAFGEGSAAKNHATPWYETIKPTSSRITCKGKILENDEALEALKRDNDRKRSLDPMSEFIINTDIVYAESKEEEYQNNKFMKIAKNSSANKNNSLSSKDIKYENRSSEESSDSDKDRKRKHKHKHKKQKKSHSDDMHNSKIDAINALRQKRLEREKAEKKKAAILLAKADIFGAR